MLLLLVDTAGTEGGVLLAHCLDESGPVEVLAEKPLAPREFSRELLPGIAKILAATKLDLSTVDAIAAIAGPGSFTGLRVGLSAVKAIAEVTGKPVIALSRLAVLASTVNRAGNEIVHNEMVHAVLEAGRGEFYHGLYRNAGSECLGEGLETLDSLRMAVEQTPGPVIVSEPAVQSALQSEFGVLLTQSVLDAGTALSLACAAWREKKFTDAAELDANYLRRLAPTPVAARAAREN
jgi:tRNA threonylcarbamoyladenosine biosynthesis protein TsaB